MGKEASWIGNHLCFNEKYPSQDLRWNSRKIRGGPKGVFVLHAFQSSTLVTPVETCSGVCSGTASTLRASWLEQWLCNELTKGPAHFSCRCRRLINVLYRPTASRGWRVTLSLWTLPEHYIQAQVLKQPRKPWCLDQGEGAICQALQIPVNSRWGGGQPKVKFIVSVGFRLHCENVKISPSILEI